MQPTDSIYDVAIVGGGLAGLSLSIQLARQKYKVLLLEREEYPFHKVCGEYISMEAWNFLESLGVPLQQLQLPVIKTLRLTAPNGSLFTTPLPLGGFGISRFLLDSTLADIARQSGVTLLEKTKVTEVVFKEGFFEIEAVTRTAPYQKITAALCCGAFGKRSNLDVKWKRDFLQNESSRISNFIGVKYHITADWPDSLIGLHNFEGGYCGISKIEGDKYCLCYMTKASQLKRSNNSIEELQQGVLYQNPHLKNIFINSKREASFPITISQISFDKKTQVEQHALMLGDAAGLITPLCGNGMSMALHSSKIAARLIQSFLEQELSLPQLEKQYQKQWEALFSKRLQAGRVLQRFFGAPILSNLFVGTFKLMPFLATGIIKRTHGVSF